jgi:hypothetical protein
METKKTPVTKGKTVSKKGTKKSPPKTKSALPRTKGTISISINTTLAAEEIAEMDLGGIIPLPGSSKTSSALSGYLTIKGSLTIDVGELAKANHARKIIHEFRKSGIKPHPNSDGNGMGMN